MKRSRLVLSVVAVATAITGDVAMKPAPPRPPRQPMLVDVAWLSKHYRDSDVVLLQVGDPQKFAVEHLPGARFIQLEDVSIQAPGEKSTLSLELPEPSALRSTLEGLGISDNSHVVVYFSEDWVTPSTRLIHTLNYAGLGDNVSLLDGGLEAWKKAAQPVTSVVVKPARGHLSAGPTADVTVSGNWVNAHLNADGVKIVDGRSRNFYEGGAGNGPGHIKGAVSLPFVEVADDANKFYPKEVLEKKFRDAGVMPGDTIVAYCHIGQQATAVVFAARLLGRTVRLYDGSFQDWKAHDWPVEAVTPAGSGK